MEAMRREGIDQVLTDDRHFEQRRISDALSVSLKTLVIGGAADQLFEEIARLIPGAQIHLFEGETHMLPIEKSGEVARATADFSGRS